MDILIQLDTVNAYLLTLITYFHHIFKKFFLRLEHVQKFYSENSDGPKFLNSKPVGTCNTCKPRKRKMTKMANFERSLKHKQIVPQTDMRINWYKPQIGFSYTNILWSKYWFKKMKNFISAKNKNQNDKAEKGKELLNRENILLCLVFLYFFYLFRGSKVCIDLRCWHDMVRMWLLGLLDSKSLIKLSMKEVLKSSFYAIVLCALVFFLNHFKHTLSCLPSLFLTSCK